MTKLPDGSGCFTATIMSAEEAMALPLRERPLNHRISSEMYHAVFEHIGEASMCWNPVPGKEVFESERASDVAVRLCFKIANEIEERLATALADKERAEKQVKFLSSTTPEIVNELQIQLKQSEKTIEWMKSHDGWEQHPYTLVLQKSLSEDYVPRVDLERAEKERDEATETCNSRSLDLFACQKERDDLCNKADMWRDEFQRIVCLIESCCADNNANNATLREVGGICERALKDIRSNISLIDQRENFARENAELRQQLSTLQSANQQMQEALNADALWAFDNKPPISLRADYETGGALTMGPNNCREFFELRRKALSSPAPPVVSLEDVKLLVEALEWAGNVNMDDMQVSACPLCYGWNPSSGAENFWKGREQRRGHKPDCALAEFNLKYPTI